MPEQNYSASANARNKPLSEPVTYFPFLGSRYDTRPNLFRLGHDFGCGELDSKVLQFDVTHDKYRQQKLVARKTALDDHYCDKLLRADAAAVNRFLVSTLLKEYPSLFSKTVSANRIEIQCQLTGETLMFSDDYHLLDIGYGKDSIETPYRTGLDALASQIQEDLCVIKIREKGDKLVCAHLSFPNKWSPREKVGGSFVSIHEPVAEFKKENRNAKSMASVLVKGGPYVRFAWGLSSDNKLDHHPATARPFVFEDGQDPLFVRVERQVLVGIQPANLLLFFIRTYYYDCHKICQDRDTREALTRSLESMSADTLSYKGLAQHKAVITRWLQKSF